jgi:hypothetical protein
MVLVLLLTVVYVVTILVARVDVDAEEVVATVVVKDSEVVAVVDETGDWAGK